MASKDQVQMILMQCGKQFRPDFADWLQDNFAVYEYFDTAAQRTWEEGFKRYSARTIIEVMRHRTNVREIGNGEWKLNDHRTPDMARLYMLLHPEQRGFFSLRGREAA